MPEHERQAALRRRKIPHDILDQIRDVKPLTWTTLAGIAELLGLPAWIVEKAWIQEVASTNRGRFPNLIATALINQMESLGGRTACQVILAATDDHDHVGKNANRCFRVIVGKVPRPWSDVVDIASWVGLDEDDVLRAFPHGTTAGRTRMPLTAILGG
jgi:hypothetical protein